MSVSSASPGFSGIRKVEILNSGTSYTVPNGVTYVNATLVGGGGGGSSDAGGSMLGGNGQPGQCQTTTLSTTPGATITYSIGAAGAAGASAGGTGGSTTMTGCTTATGGLGGTPGGAQDSGPAGKQSWVNNGGHGGAYRGSASGGAGGPGWIELEYWL
jgi:hypothetical protein